MEIRSASLVVTKMQIKIIMRYISHVVGWLESKRRKITSVDKDSEKVEASYTVGRNVK